MKCIKDLHLEMFLSFNLKVANDNTVLIDSCRLFHNLGLLLLSKPQLLTCYYSRAKLQSVPSFPGGGSTSTHLKFQSIEAEGQQ